MTQEPFSPVPQGVAGVLLKTPLQPLWRDLTMSALLEQRFATRLTLGALSVFGMLSTGACFTEPLDGGASGNQSCPLGAVGCFCNPDGSCDGQLACVSDRCVNLNLTSEQGSSKAGTKSTSSEDAKTGEATSTSEKGGQNTSSKGSSQPSDASNKGTTSDSEDPDSSIPDASCKDDKKNGQESDVDCGGPDCSGCRVGQTCVQNDDCRSDNCEAGTCAKAIVTCDSDADCKDDNPCTQDLCNAQKLCENPPGSEGQRCNDADACTRADKCVQGRCEGVDTRVFREDFSKAPYAFLNGSTDEFRHWEIGPAVASSCAAKGSVNDPGQDHSQDGANGVMGVHIGGCQTTRQDNFQDCAWSDYVDVSGFESDVLFSYWRHLSSPGRDPVSRFIPMVTNSIYYRKFGAGSPTLIEEGWPKAVNDQEWTYIEHRVPSDGLEKVSFGICYKRLGSTGGYPGWTVDDVRVRQFGCEMATPE